MAIAITPFRGFCGFLPPPDVSRFLVSVPEFAKLIPSTTVESFLSVVSKLSSPSTPAVKDTDVKAVLKELFGALMKAPANSVQEAISSVSERFRNGQVAEVEKPVRDLFLELDSQFPGDVGVLAVYFLNVVSLEAGQAVFLKANEPHAYISGGGGVLHDCDLELTQFLDIDIIETMASSG